MLWPVDFDFDFDCWAQSRGDVRRTRQRFGLSSTGSLGFGGIEIEIEIEIGIVIGIDYLSQSSGGCGVPSERISVSGPFPGLHPSLVCVAPLGRERKGPAKTKPDARLNHPLGAIRLS